MLVLGFKLSLGIVFFVVAPAIIIIGEMGGIK